MYSDEAFRELSREHAEARVVAEALATATSGNAAAVAGMFLDFFEALRWEHVPMVEMTLLPCVPDYELADRVRDEHAKLRVHANALSGGQYDAGHLQRLGALLADHVELEERELLHRSEVVQRDRPAA
jgi:hypothetical protein